MAPVRYVVSLPAFGHQRVRESDGPYDFNVQVYEVHYLVYDKSTLESENSRLRRSMGTAINTVHKRHPL